MAFLASEDRFGPDLDRYRQGEPNPCTYTSAEGGLELPGGKHASGTFGYHRPEQHERPSHFLNAASSSPAIAATLRVLEENSLQRMRDTSVPHSCTYSPTMEGQFPRTYTTSDIQAERKRATSHVKNQDSIPARELHLALGPGSYNTDQEMISTPFSFTHEKRHGILENTAALGRVGCSPGPALYRIEGSMAVHSASAVASTPFRSKHATAFIMRVRSDSQLHQQQKKDAAVYSKELAKSYQELGASVQRLGKRLASPELREQIFRRFDKDVTALEAYRRGPGSYDPACKCDNITCRQKANADENGKSEETPFQLTKLSGKPTIGSKRNSSFGGVASRDLLTSMIAAGHASAHTIGPGVYDAYSPSFIVPTHNLGYKQPTTKARSTSKASSGADDGIGSGTRRLSHREMWKAMKQGPTLP